MNTADTKGTEETTDPSGPAAAAAAAEPPPSTVSLDVLKAMHDRLLRYGGRVDELTAMADKIVAAQGQLSEAIRNDVLPHLSDLADTVAQHAELLDGHGKVLDDVAAAVARGAAPPPPTRRGDLGPRQLPAAAPEPDSASGEGGATELQIDPRQPGRHVVRLATGGDLEINVRRPAPSRSPMIRDGQPTGGGRTRRG